MLNRDKVKGKKKKKKDMYTQMHPLVYKKWKIDQELSKH